VIRALPAFAILLCGIAGARAQSPVHAVLLEILAPTEAGPDRGAVLGSIEIDDAREQDPARNREARFAGRGIEGRPSRIRLLLHYVDRKRDFVELRVDGQRQWTMIERGEVPEAFDFTPARSLGRGGPALVLAYLPHEDAADGLSFGRCVELLLRRALQVRGLRGFGAGLTRILERIDLARTVSPELVEAVRMRFRSSLEAGLTSDPASLQLALAARAQGVRLPRAVLDLAAETLAGSATPLFTALKLEEDPRERSELASVLLQAEMGLRRNALVRRGFVAMLREGGVVLAGASDAAEAARRLDCWGREGDPLWAGLGVALTGLALLAWTALAGRVIGRRLS
jgi:hypothetical protein